MGKLKLCPFCGGKGVLERKMIDPECFAARVRCEGCGAEVGRTNTAISGAVGYPAVEHLWNNRVKHVQDKQEER